MATHISRRKLSQHAAGMIIKGEISQAVEQLAAYLVQSGRTREAGLIVRDIEVELAELGTVVATVTTAHALSDELRAGVNTLIGAREPHVKEIVDPAVIGGIKIDMPGKQYDATVRRKLELLKELTLV